MKQVRIYDISQEVFSCEVYPGDPSPRQDRLSSISSGEVCNLTAFSMCAHNGTHIDAPYHFIEDGMTVDKIPPHYTTGYAYVAKCKGILTKSDAKRILDEANAISAECAKRILLGGDVTVSEDAALVFFESGVLLLGNESQTVGPAEAPMRVHKILLGGGAVLLEGIRLSGVAPGVYFLCAAPISLGGADGAPCRAQLIEFI